MTSPGGEGGARVMPTGTGTAGGTGASSGSGEDLRDHSIGELLKELSQETTTLVRKELELARAELTVQGKQAGKGAGMLGGAGIAALLMLGALTATVIALLD